MVNGTEEVFKCGGGKGAGRAHEDACPGGALPMSHLQPFGIQTGCSIFTLNAVCTGQPVMDRLSENPYGTWTLGKKRRTLSQHMP